MADHKSPDEFRLRAVDKAILQALTHGRDTDDPWGRDSPGKIAEQIEFSSQHVIDRMNVLQAGGYVRKRGRGLYEITDQGIIAVESE